MWFSIDTAISFLRKRIDIHPGKYLFEVDIARLLDPNVDPPEGSRMVYWSHLGKPRQQTSKSRDTSASIVRQTG